MKTKINLFLLSAVFTLLMGSCNNDDIWVNDSSNDLITTKIKSDLDIIHSLGFDTTKTVVSDSFYVVEKDIAFRKDKIKDYLNNLRGTTRQARTTYIVSPKNIKYIRLKIDDSLFTSNWREAILQAINEYNKISGTAIYFIKVSFNYDLLIKKEVNVVDPNVLGQGTFPINGKVGNLIRINTNYSDDLTLSQKIQLIVHELGHNIGLRHTNWYGLGEGKGDIGAIGIPGTPNSGTNPDPKSVMNGKTGGDDWIGFSTSDLVALRTLYPTPTLIVSGPLFFPTNLLYKSSTIYSYYTNATGVHDWVISNEGTSFTVNTTNNHLELKLKAATKDGKDEHYIFSCYSHTLSQNVNKEIIVPDGYHFISATPSRY